MNGDSGPEDTARGGQNGDTGTDIWGARNSLRRHAGLDKIQGDSEVTPLLASGSSASGSNGQGDGDGNGDAPQWEGHADFEGLNWRHKPSVSWTGFCLGFGGSGADNTGRCSGYCPHSSSLPQRLVELWSRNSTYSSLSYAASIFSRSLPRIRISSSCPSFWAPVIPNVESRKSKHWLQSLRCISQ